jgi:signal peptidase II
MKIWLWLSAAIVVLDQLSKYYMSQILSLCEPGNCTSQVILPVFKLTLLHNEGAAFSFLSDAGGWQRWFFTAVSAIVSTVLVVWICRLKKHEKLLTLALALILGGAVGNLLDRVSLGYVIDFIVVHYDNHYFPAFNVADSAISIGAAVMILDMLITGRENGAADKETMVNGDG